MFTLKIFWGSPNIHYKRSFILNLLGVQSLKDFEDLSSIYVGDLGGEYWGSLMVEVISWIVQIYSHNSHKICSSKCTTASQPQSLAIFWIAGEIARNFRSEKQIWPFFIAKCIATATVSLPQRNRNLFPRKNRCVQFDRVNESQTSTANHRRETVHLAPDHDSHKIPTKLGPPPTPIKARFSIWANFRPNREEKTQDQS